MSRREMKARAMSLIQTTRPNPCLVTLAVLAYGWLITWMSQRIGGQPVYIDLQALQAMDTAHAVGLDWSNVTPVTSLFLLVFEVLSILLNVGYVRYGLNVCREEKSGFSDLLAGFEFALRAIGLWLLSHIIVLVLSLFLLIPGIIASYAYSMAVRLLCDHPDWSPVRCLRESRALMRGHKWELFVLQLSFLGWMLLTVIPVASIFVDPYIALTETTFYLQLTGTKTAAREDGGDESEEKPPWEY